MKKVARIAIIILLITIAGGLIVWALRPAEPVYAGKPLSFWMDTIENVSPGFGPPPVWQTLDTNTVSVLIKALELCDSPLTWNYAKLRNRFWRFVPSPILRHLPRPRDTETIGINATLWLWSMGDDARPAIPVLIRTMKADSSTLKQFSVLRGQAAVCLGRIGTGDQRVSDALIATLDDKDVHVRHHALEALQQVDRKAAEKFSEK